ncbi:hypothetical protein D3C76_1437790 [compost metagenome]
MIRTIGQSALFMLGICLPCLAVANGGSLQFTGSIVEGPCRIDTRILPGAAGQQVLHVGMSDCKTRPVATLSDPLQAPGRGLFSTSLTQIQIPVPKGAQERKAWLLLTLEYQ